MIKYKSGFNHQLVEDAIFQTGILDHGTKTRFIELDETGELLVNAGYAWDGSSGPSVDTKAMVEGSLPHDVLYQLIRMKLLPPVYKATADIVYRDTYLAAARRGESKYKAVAGLQRTWSAFRGWYSYEGVKRFADFAADPANRKPVIVAP